MSKPRNNLGINDTLLWSVSRSARRRHHCKCSPRIVIAHFGCPLDASGHNKLLSASFPDVLIGNLSVHNSKSPNCNAIPKLVVGYFELKVIAIPLEEREKQFPCFKRRLLRRPALSGAPRNDFFLKVPHYPAVAVVEVVPIFL